jgi:hypothetical protein
MKLTVAVAILAVAATPAWAHRLDEYLQGTIVSIERNRFQAQLTLTPGVAVFPFVIADIDTNSDGTVSPEEQQAYATRVLQDLSLAIDGTRLTPQLLTVNFPTVDEMKEGRGAIQLDFAADLPRGGGHRKLAFENHHLARIAAYQVNSLVPRDPNLRITAQTRNYTQSVYQLEYDDTGVPSQSSERLLWASPVALLLLFRLPFWRRERRVR